MVGVKVCLCLQKRENFCQYKEIAELMNQDFKRQIKEIGKVSWMEILDSDGS